MMYIVMVFAYVANLIYVCVLMYIRRNVFIPTRPVHAWSAGHLTKKAVL